MKSSRHLLLLFVCLGLASVVLGQTGRIGGTVMSSGRELLPGATASLVTPKDSVTKRTVLVDSAGKFLFTGVPLGSYILKIAALNYETARKVVRVTAGRSSITLDSVILASSYESMGGITIVAHRRVMSVRNDTSEFNARAFRVRTNGTAEDLFKKVPGLDVDPSGTVKAQGEQVTQIYVDGKPFMGTDLKTVMENFPADVIDKIQIIDKKSDQALATGVEDGQHQKIINITLKKDRKRGVFGNDYLGVGTDGRYEAKSNTNMFNGNRKLTIVIGGNNDGRSDNGNSSTATTDATYNNWNGVTDYKQAKINFANKIGKTFDYSLYGGTDRYKTVKYQDIEQQNIFTDSSNFYHETDSTTSIYQNTNGGLYFEFKPDTLNFMRFNEDAGFVKSSSYTNALFSTIDPDSALVNNGNRYNGSSTSNPFLNGNISFNHRFRGSHRSLFLNFSNNLNNTNTGAYTISTNNFFPVDSTAYQQFVNQFQKNPNRNSTIGTTVSYSEPVTTRSTMNISYNYNYGKNDVPQTAFDYNPTTKGYDLPNDTLTSHFTDLNYLNNVTLSYNYGTGKTGFGAGVRYLDATTNGESFGTKDSSVRQTYTGFAPNLSFYSNGTGKRFYIYYNFSVQAPLASQLQPVVNNTNPLYEVLGNPDLKYAETHTVHYWYNYYNAKKETGFNSSATFNDIVDYISNSTTTDNATGSQVSQPVNLNGAYNWNAWISYFRPLPIGDDKIKWDVNLWAQGSRNVNLLNGEDNVNQSNYAKFHLGFTYDTPKWIDLHTNFSLARQESDYSLEPTLNNVAYFLDLNPNVTFVVAPRTEFNIDYDYRQSSGQSAGFNTSVNMLNADFVQYFDSKKDFWLKIKGYDLLNQNISVWRTTGSSSITDTRSNVLTRFVLVSLNIRINKFLAPSTPASDQNGEQDPDKGNVM